MFKKLLLVASLMLASQVVFSGGIVVFDPQEAFIKTAAVQKRIQKLQEEPEYAQLIAQAEGLRADLEALTKEKNSKGMTWGKEKHDEHGRKEQAIQAEFRLATQRIQAENNAAVSPILQELQPLLDPVLSSIIATENIEMILQQQAAIFAHPAADITFKVTQGINRAAAAKTAQKKK